VRDRTAELLQSEKMAAVGRLAASIAHEINSPLGVITSNIDMLRHLATTVAGDQHREIVDDIAATFATANARLNRVIKAFQVLTGLDQAELRPVDINTLLDEVLTLTQGEAGTGVEVIRKSGALDRVLCSPGRVAQAFLNILTNAVQSLNGNGQIVIRTEQLEKRVRVVIADTGRGMTREQIATAFDPGFQRKDGRVSASLGLMITAQVIREHRGEIHIESTPGSGTIVTVTLPN
jgi:signal transduction histidine kinase